MSAFELTDVLQAQVGLLGEFHLCHLSREAARLDSRTEFRAEGRRGRGCCRVLATVGSHERRKLASSGFVRRQYRSTLIKSQERCWRVPA